MMGVILSVGLNLGMCVLEEVILDQIFASLTVEMAILYGLNSVMTQMLYQVMGVVTSV